MSITQPHLAELAKVSTKSRIEKLLKPFLEKQPFVETLISRSFLNDSAKREYLLNYKTRRNYLIT